MKLVAVIQTVIPLEGRKRRLNDKEKQLLERVFHHSLYLPNIRIDEGFAGMYSLNNLPFTVGNVIYLKNRAEPELLLHECIHVWQYQHKGSRYITDALYAQWRNEDNTEYKWEQQISPTCDKQWVGFNVEAQGRFFEDIYTHGELLTGQTPTPRGNGVFFEANGHKGRFLFHGKDHTLRANAAVSAVRGEVNLAQSIFSLFSRSHTNHLREESITENNTLILH